MPRHRKSNETNLIKEQKKLIASRLMQISLKVDNYVYKNIPITEKSAEMFIKEVNSYTDKCYGDRPSLQVIEKLTRCMKGIIAEQQELRQGCGEDPNDVTLVDVESILASSVDEDLTQCTQKNDKILDLTRYDIMEVRNRCDGGNNNNKHLDSSEKELKAICNDKTDTKKKDINCNEHLHKALSELSILDEDPLSITTLEPVCSQSILNNFEPNNILKYNKRENTAKILFSQDFDEDIQYGNFRPDTNVNFASAAQTLDKVNYTNSSYTLNTTEFLKVPGKNNSNMKTIKNITQQKEKRKRGLNKIKQCNIKSKQNNEQTAAKRNKRGKRSENINNPSTKVPDIDAITFVKLNCGIAKGKNIPVLSSTDNSYQQVHCAQVENTPNMKAIYKENVENDLSWIENIRYVREVTEEENIPAFFEDGFWDNYALPNDWNNDDFL